MGWKVRVAVCLILPGLASAAASQTTAVPSSVTPAGTNQYQAIYRRARFISYLAEALNKYSVSVQVRRELARLEPDILGQMPAEGGVLVFVWIATEKNVGFGIPRSRQVRSVSIAGAGLDRKEAMRRYDSIPQLSADPSRPTDRHFFELRREEVWIPTHAVASARVGPEVEKMLARYAQETRRLDAEWKWLVAEHLFLEEIQPKKQTGSPAGTSEMAREKLLQAEALFRAWTEAQTKLIRNQEERRAAQTAALSEGKRRLANMERDTDTLKRQLDTMTYRSCPNRRSFEECTHEDLKKAYTDAAGSMRRDYENRSRALQEWRAALARNEQDLGILSRETTERISRFGKQREDSLRRIEELQAAWYKQRERDAAEAGAAQTARTDFLERMQHYRRDRQRMQELERNIEKAAAAGAAQP